MKIGELLKGTMLFLSAFSPMFLLFAGKSLFEIFIYDTSLKTTLNYCIIVALILIAIISIVFAFIFLKKPLKNNYDKVLLLEVKNHTPQYFLSYFALFVLLAFSFDIKDSYYLIILLCLIIIIGIVYISNELFFLNPLFNLIGYKIYYIEYKKEKSNIKQFTYLITRTSLLKQKNSEIIVDNSEYDFVKQIKDKKEE